MNKPIIPTKQPRPTMPTSNAGWAIPLLIFEFIVLGVAVLYFMP